MKYYEWLYLICIIVYIIAMYILLNHPRFKKKLLPPNQQEMSQRDIAMMSVLIGTICGVVVASILWFLYHTSCRVMYGVYRECYDDEEEKARREREEMEKEKQMYEAQKKNSMDEMNAV
jgi:hypothetical protein